MNTAGEKALRALADAGIGGPPVAVVGEEGGAAKVGMEEGRLPDVPSSGHRVKERLQEGPRSGEPFPEHSRTAEPCVPDGVLTARYPLAALCRATLDANPAAGKLTPDGRKWVAEHLEAAVLCWLSHILKPEPAWDAVCPNGHRITEGIFAKALMGWCCAECEQVYPAGDCKLRTSQGSE